MQRIFFRFFFLQKIEKLIKKRLVREKREGMHAELGGDAGEKLERQALLAVFNPADRGLAAIHARGQFLGGHFPPVAVGFDPFADRESVHGVLLPMPRGARRTANNKIHSGTGAIYIVSIPRILVTKCEWFFFFRERAARVKTIFVASLGCAKNLVDAETMLGETLGERFALAVAPEEADIVIVNTCGFIAAAREESGRVIEECLEVKKRSGGAIKVVAAGCWAERDPERLRAEFPRLDAVWGLGVPSDLAGRIDALDGKKPGSIPLAAGLGADALPREGARLVTTLPSFAYLRLSDGCDNRCAYCAIPLIRGGLKSRDPEAVLREAKALERQGARELVVIAQDTTAYGADLGHGNAGGGLGALLRRLLDSVAVPRLRLLYAHPARLGDDVVDLLLNEPRLCRYLDLPLQHAADPVLAAMGRGYGRERIDALLERFSGKDFTLRTTLLLGFPGETERDFLQALDLVNAGRFRHLGAFAYSPEPGTPAFGLPGQVPPEEAERRRAAVMEAQEAVAFAWLDSRVGGVEDILIDARPEKGLLSGRSTAEAPDADGVIYVKSGTARPGDRVNACIVKREGYDLLADAGAANPTKSAKKRKKR